jgi:coatomer protein complex subunit epsilon
LKAQYEAAAGNTSKQNRILDQLKSLASSDPNTTAQLTAAQVCLASDDTASAWNFVSNSTTPEMMACKLQILLKLDRPDLAQQQFALMKKENEESVLGELASVYLQLYQGSSQAGDAEHTLNSLTEQYGPSVFLLNLLAAALAVQGDYVAAETKLMEALKDFGEIQPQHETYMNLIAVLHQQNKKAEAAAMVETLLGSTLPNATSLAFKEGLQRVTAAFDREAIKYKV